METFKSIVVFCLSPLIVALALQLLGWGLHRKRHSSGMKLICAGGVVLLLGSLGGWSWESRRAAEFSSVPLTADRIPAAEVLIVVLGTGFNPDPILPANSQVGGTFLARLLEGVRIWRLRPDAELMVSVAGPATDRQKQAFWSDMQALLGLQSARVTLLTDAESTLDEARLVGRACRGRTVLLATSAGHLPRAMQIFRSEGLSVLAAPTDYGFVRKDSPRDRWWPAWIPSTDGLAGNHAWLYEQVAIVWQMLRQMAAGG